MKIWRNIVITFVVLAGIGVFRVPIIQAVSAGYNSTVRVVSSTGTVLDGVASAVTANYTSTVRIVDSTGHVLDSFGGGSGTVTSPALAAYTGSVGLTGTQFNGGDFVKNLCMNGVCPVTAFGASGSTATCSGTIAANSTSLAVSVCSPSNDFQTGQYVLIPQAGPAALPTGAMPTVTAAGTFGAGASTWGYKVSYRDRWGGQKTASTEVTIATGQTTASGVNYAKVVLGAQAGGYSYDDVCVYRTTAPGSIATGLIGVIPGSATSATLGDTNLPVISITACPAAPPASDTNQYLVAKITAGGGTATLTLGTAASSVAPGTAMTIIHDETQAFQNAVNAAATIGGRVQVPAGTYYLDQPSIWNGSAWVYTNPTDTSATSNEQLGTVHLASGVTIQGDDYSSSILKTPYQVALQSYTLAVANPTATRTPGAPCNSGASADFVKKLINNAFRGASIVTTTTASDAGTFTVGQRVYIGGGVVSGNVSCTNTALTVMRVVTGVDTSTGNVNIYPALDNDFPYGTAGTASFIADATPWTYHDVTVQNLTIDSTSGNSAITLQSTLHGRIDRVALTSEKWSTSLNVSGAEDVMITNSPLWYSTGGEEIDQASEITFDHNIIKQESGSAQLSFDEGSMGVKFTNNEVASDDHLTGLNNRTATIIENQVTCANNVQIEGNTFKQTGTNVATNEIFNQPSACNATGQPLPFNWRIHANHIQQYAPVGIALGITESGSAIVNQVISDNDIWIDAGVSSSYGIKVLAGQILNNTISAVGSHMGGIIGVATAAAITEPLSIQGNSLKSDGSQICLQINNTAAMPLYVHRNACVTTGAAISLLQTINSTNYPTTYIDQQDAFGAGAYTAGLPYAFGATHGALPPTSVASGSFTTGSTDNYFEVSGATVFTTGNIVTFQKAFAKTPTCTCSDETTTTAILGCPTTTTTARTGLGAIANDTITCTVSGF